MTTSWNNRSQIGNNILSVIYTGYWDDTQIWNDTQIWSDTGGVTAYGTRSIPTTSYSARDQLERRQVNANIQINAHVKVNGDQTTYNTRNIP